MLMLLLQQQQSSSSNIPFVLHSWYPALLMFRVDCRRILVWHHTHTHSHTQTRTLNNTCSKSIAFAWEEGKVVAVAATVAQQWLVSRGISFSFFVCFSPYFALLLYSVLQQAFNSGYNFFFFNVKNITALANATTTIWFTLIFFFFSD